MNKSISISLTFPSTLFIVFLVLKLTNTINWSWWWVTSPLWIPFALVLFIVIIVIIATFIRSVKNKQKKK